MAKEKKVLVTRAISSRTGKPVDSKILESTGTMFDPASQHVDLTKVEKRRMTALMLASQAYAELIIKDAEMYRAIRQHEGIDPTAPKIRPATINAIVLAAMQFDAFIAGEYTKEMALPEEENKPTSANTGITTGVPDNE